MKRRGPGRDRRRSRASPGAHPERRVLSAKRRAVPRPTPAGPRGFAVVLPPVVNMFERADAASPVVSQATLGSSVTLLDAARGFDLVETADRYRGWIRSIALRPVGRGGTYPRADRACRVKNFMCQIYSARDVTASSPIATAPLLSFLEIVEDQREWKRVRLPDGRRGWAQSGDLEPWAQRRESRTAAPPDGRAVAATALRFLGLPYVWGGTTPFGLDCSGLSQLVYRMHGRLLPRDADLQYADPNLRAVEGSDLVAGDLVFFGPGEGNITHVGIALDRDRFVSATTFRSPIVQVDRLDEAYWSGLYRGARRPSVLLF